MPWGRIRAESFVIKIARTPRFERIAARKRIYLKKMCHSKTKDVIRLILGQTNPQAYIKLR